MVRIEVTMEWDQNNRFFDVERTTYHGGPAFETKDYLFYPHEVRVLGKHEGEYDPNHWGELNPDAYDRSGYDTNHGRHLLDTGVN